MKISYDWLHDYLGNGTPSLEEIERLLTFHAFEIDGIETVGSQRVLDVNVLPNRAADCLSHCGIAGEISALTGTPLLRDRRTVEWDTQPSPALMVTVDEARAQRFACAHISGIVVQPSPQWLAERLEAMGQRPINLVVDVTNYVMFALGQPLHAYDAAKLVGDDTPQYYVGVRAAREQEEVTDLSGDTHVLTADMSVITNAHTDEAIGIAGIKGGAVAAIDATTTSIILEAGNFNPVITRATSQKLRLATDASKRFENQITPALVAPAMAMAIELLHAALPAMKVETSTDFYPTPVQSWVVSVRPERISALLGLKVEDATAIGILKGLGCRVVASDGVWQVTPPLERVDLQIEADFIEEVGRVVGYQQIASVVPDKVALTAVNPRHYYSEKVREHFYSAGFSEVITSTFRNKDVVQLRNALASDKSCLRSALHTNLTEVLQKNISHKDLLGVERLQVFEIGTVFTKENKCVKEHVSLALGVRHKASGPTPKDDAAVTEYLRGLEELLGVTVGATVADGVAEINFTEVVEKLPVPDAYESAPPVTSVTYRPFSIYPAVSRDIAIWVSAETTADVVKKILDEAAGSLRVRTTLFDEFTKENRTSLAFRLVFQSSDKTLTDEEVNTVMDQVNKAVTAQGWEVR